MSVTILGIETSCDETSASVVRDGRAILSNVIYSQVKEHAVFGGVVPEVASRRHLETVVPVVGEALKAAGVGLDEIDAVAATYGPGLVGALLVGFSYAKALAYIKGKPFIGVHHIAAHICAHSLCDSHCLCASHSAPRDSHCLCAPHSAPRDSHSIPRDLQSPGEPPVDPPFTALVVSGGHSHIYHVENYGNYRLLGRTRDDAAGEVFDKVARASGLGYPGGPRLDAAASGGDPDAVKLPRTLFRDGSFDFSFSGVKTAAVNRLNRERALSAGGVLPDDFMRNFYAGFQAAVVDVLVANTVAAETANPTGKIVLAGGVAANSALRERFTHAASDSVCATACAAGKGAFSVHFPPPVLCTDNAAMVAARAYYSYIAGEFSPLSLGVSPTILLD